MITTTIKNNDFEITINANSINDLGSVLSALSGSEIAGKNTSKVTTNNKKVSKRKSRTERWEPEDINKIVNIVLSFNSVYGEEQSMRVSRIIRYGENSMGNLFKKYGRGGTYAAVRRIVTYMDDPLQSRSTASYVKNIINNTIRREQNTDNEVSAFDRGFLEA